MLSQLYEAFKAHALARSNLDDKEALSKMVACAIKITPDDALSESSPSIQPDGNKGHLNSPHCPIIIIRIICSLNLESPVYCITGVIRAFTQTLNLINAAEVYHRLRLLRNADIVSGQVGNCHCCCCNSVTMFYFSSAQYYCLAELCR